MSKKIRNKVPVLVLASLGVLGTAYIPQEVKVMPSHEFVTKVYARPTQHECLYASIKRKIEILRQIREIRAQIRTQADLIALHEKNQINYGRTTELSYKLLMDIVNSKKISV